MKVAIAINENMCPEHFGHCKSFKIYDIENDKINSDEYVENPGHKPGFLPKFLKEKGVNTIIAGSMGDKAQQIFKFNNIEIIVGVNGKADDIIKLYMTKKLVSDNSVCNKHEHEGHCED